MVRGEHLSENELSSFLYLSSRCVGWDKLYLTVMSARAKLHWRRYRHCRWLSSLSPYLVHSHFQRDVLLSVFPKGLRDRMFAPF